MQPKRIVISGLIIFSARAMKNPQSLFATPDATLIRKSSHEARRANETVINTTTIYRFCVFLKDVFGSSCAAMGVNGHFTFKC